MSQSSPSRLPDDHPARKDLRPFGHECSRWLAAMAMLQNRQRKGRLPERLAAFLTNWMPEASVSTELPEVFEISLLDGQLSTPDAVLAPVTDPVWQALLHLPALREFWTAELRASHFEHLQRRVPRAWCMDPEPLPPGTVIAGLGITGWHELPRLEADGRQFAQHAADENKVVLAAVSAIGDGWRARYTRRDGQISLEDVFQG